LFLFNVFGTSMNYFHNTSKLAYVHHDKKWYRQLMAMTCNEKIYELGKRKGGNNVNL